MKEYVSIVDNRILDQFSLVRGNTLFNNFQNTCNVEQTISCASLFWPEVVEIDDCIFIKQFYNNYDMDELMRRFNHDKKEIERWVNAWSISDLFLMARTDSLNNDDILIAFEKALVFFWRLRFKELFPDRKIVVETGLQLYGENGMAIVVYQEW